MKKYFLILLIAFGMNRAFAQPISLDSALALAQKNHSVVREQEALLRAAEWQLQEARYDLLPEINMEYNMQRNLVIPSTPVPVGLFQEGAPTDQFQALRFGTRWASDAGISASYPLFNPARRVALREYTHALSREAAKLRYTEQEVATEVSRAYVAALVAQAQVQLAKQQVLHAEAELYEIRQQVEEGRLPITELNDGLLTLGRSASRLREAHQVEYAARADLAYWAESSTESVLNWVLSDSIPQLWMRWSGNLPTELGGNSATLEQLEAEKQIAYVRWQASKKEYLPTVSLVGYAGANYFSNEFDPVAGDKWFGNSYIGLSVKMPIMQVMEQSRKVARLQARWEAEQQRQSAFQSKQDRDWQKAQSELNWLRAEWDAKNSEVALAEKNAQIAQELLAKGKVLPSESGKARLSLLVAQTDALEALFRALDAAILLDWLAKR